MVALGVGLQKALSLGKLEILVNLIHLGVASPFHHIEEHLFALVEVKVPGFEESEQLVSIIGQAVVVAVAMAMATAMLVPVVMSRRCML